MAKLTRSTPGASTHRPPAVPQRLEDPAELKRGAQVSARKGLRMSKTC